VCANFLLKTLFFFLIFVLVMVFLLYSVYPLFFCGKKGDYFCCFGPGMYLNQNGQWGSLLVTYVGYILDDKNTLCNGCYLNRIISLIQNLQVLWKVFISSHVPCHKFLEDVHEDSMQSQLADSNATVWIGL
jgi:hypothetical protein